MAKSNAISELLTRGVLEVIIQKNLEEKLRSQKNLRIKFGIDPTAPDMHLGHLVPLKKLRAFQELGHTIVFIMGDFTAMIGDPTGRSELRKPLTREQTRKNAEDYLNEAGKILDIKKAEVHFNSEWLDKLGITGLFELTSKVTVQRALERDDFQNRIKEGHDISMVETLYPLLQGYDSVAIKADVEIGGTDQKFNLLMGRRVQRRYDIPEQDIMTLTLIEGTDGVRKMSKSYGNYISLRDTPSDIFGKVMSVPDDLLLKYLKTLSEISMTELSAWEHMWNTDRKNFPARDLKMKLGREMAALCHGKRAGEEAQGSFVSQFQKKEMPSEIPEKRLPKKSYDVCELLLEAGLASSKSEARRLVTQGGITIDQKRVADPKIAVALSKTPMLIQVGKRKFLRVTAK